MEKLRTIIEKIGGRNVATYIQSGNAILSHASRSPRKLESDLEAALLKSTGMTVPVVIRTPREWSEVVEANPFPGAAGTQLHVVFTKAPLAQSAFSGVDLASVKPEALVIAERHYYMHLPEGMGRAKLPILLDRRGPRGIVGTARNWNTVLKLREMIGRL
jgi:uncharacterized protein (DUF1697 family)